MRVDIRSSICEKTALACPSSDTDSPASVGCISDSDSCLPSAFLSVSAICTRSEESTLKRSTTIEASPQSGNRKTANSSSNNWPNSTMRDLLPGEVLDWTADVADEEGSANSLRAAI